MTETHRTATVVVAIVLFVVGLFVGFKLLTASADTFDEAPTCENRTVAEGDKLTSNLVTVNVYNASQRCGPGQPGRHQPAASRIPGRHRGQQHE